MVSFGCYDLLRMLLINTCLLTFLCMPYFWFNYSAAAGNDFMRCPTSCDTLQNWQQTIRWDKKIHLKHQCSVCFLDRFCT